MDVGEVVLVLPLGVAELVELVGLVGLVGVVVLKLLDVLELVVLKRSVSQHCKLAELYYLEMLVLLVLLMLYQSRLSVILGQRRPKGYFERVLIGTCLVFGVVGLGIVLRKSQYAWP